MARKFPIFNKYFIILMIVNFIVAFSYYITFVTTISFAINNLHTSNALAGLASGIFIIGALFARLIFGSQADSLYLKPVLVLHSLFICLLHLYIFLDIGGGVGPYIFGFAGEKLGYAYMYQISACLVFIVLILYFIMIFRKNRE